MELENEDGTGLEVKREAGRREMGVGWGEFEKAEEDDEEAGRVMSDKRRVSFLRRYLRFKRSLHFGP